MEPKCKLFSRKVRNIIWQKNVLIADRRECGWAMVWRSMKEDELADNSDDDIIW